MRPERLLARLLQGHYANVKFDDFLALARAFGFSVARVRGSHHFLYHPKVGDGLSVQRGRTGDAKAYQLKQLIDAVEEFGLTMEDDR